MARRHTFPIKYKTERIEIRCEKKLKEILINEVKMRGYASTTELFNIALKNYFNNHIKFLGDTDLIYLHNL